MHARASHHQLQQLGIARELPGVLFLFLSFFIASLALGKAKQSKKSFSIQLSPKKGSKILVWSVL